MEESYNEDEDLEDDLKKLYDDIINLAVGLVKEKGKSVKDAVNLAAAQYEVNAEDFGLEYLIKKVNHKLH